MSFFEDELIKKVSVRFRELRGSRQIETISSGQVSTIKRIESGKNIKSGNFIPDSLLEDYSRIFKIKKVRLIFGTDSEIEELLEITFDNYFQEILSKKKINDELGNFNKSFIDYLCIFAKFSTWYNLDMTQLSDISFEAPWILIKRKLTRSFKNNVIKDIFNDMNRSFKFVEINQYFERWLENDLSDNFFPEIIESLKKNTIFKIGYMVDTLMKEFIESDIPIIENDSIPFNFSRGIRNPDYKPTYIVKTKEGDILVSKDRPNEEDGVHPIKLVSLNKNLNKDEFTDLVKQNIAKFGGHVPGILTINSRASKYIQLELNDLMLNHVKELTKYQNYLLSLIRFSELENFL